MKWLLLSVLIGLMVGRRALLGGLLEALRSAPHSFRAERTRAAEPSDHARDITPAQDRGVDAQAPRDAPRRT